MLVVGVFQITTELEQVLSLLEQKGMEREQMVAVPMDLDANDDTMDPIRSRDRKAGGFELGMGTATAFSVIGVSRGFILEWGPIVWGLIASGIGFLVGLALHLIIVRVTGAKREASANLLPEVTVLIRCQPERLDEVRKLLWQHQAISVGVVNR
ncbi:hypothetical protein FHS18_005088 [Paenibacillus phyllosphaerae]|uniref:Uncharacterized protein n=1 Tax=Paenibacillus phyllosphaerae TaxID=274593 RepID=A0A7W5B3G9_9BACL|nr:hypothetical protein [Paenibacillus phyllosphaerae]MBB3112986.1 hypothetical protein [Paenibacillus phyllosphaerae]